MKTTEINQLQAVLIEFKDIYPDMSINMALTFLEVAKSNGTTTTDIEKLLGSTQSAASRNLRFFDQLQKAGKPGKNLFRLGVSATDLRTKVRHLNEEGEKVMHRISTVWSGK